MLPEKTLLLGFSNATQLLYLLPQLPQLLELCYLLWGSLLECIYFMMGMQSIIFGKNDIQLRQCVQGSGLVYCFINKGAKVQELLYLCVPMQLYLKMGKMCRSSTLLYLPDLPFCLPVLPNSFPIFNNIFSGEVSNNVLSYLPTSMAGLVAGPYLFLQPAEALLQFLVARGVTHCALCPAALSLVGSRASRTNKKVPTPWVLTIYLVIKTFSLGVWRGQHSCRYYSTKCGSRVVGDI